MDLIKLPEPKYDSSFSLEKALNERKSVRDFKDETLSLDEISQLLWAVQGLTKKESRTVPSAGALYPLEIYLVAGNVKGLDSAVYKYRIENHELEKVTDGDKRKELANAALKQFCVERAAINIVISGIYERTTGKYGDRGIQYVYIEVGCAAQNLYLETTALGLGTVFIGAFEDEEMRRILNMPSQEKPFAILPIGKNINFS